MGILVILQQMIMLAILVAIGILLFKKDILSEKVTQAISIIIIDICNPAMMLSAAVNGNINLSGLDLLIALGISILVLLLLCIWGYFMPRLLKVGKNKRRFYEVMAVYTNCGFMGIPLAKAVLNDNAMIYLVIFNVAFSLFFYTHGVTILGSGKEKINLKNMINSGLIVAILIVVLCVFNIKLPGILNNTVTYIGNATTFLSMILLGASIAKAVGKKVIFGYKLIVFSILRMVLIPIIFALALHYLGFNDDLVYAMALICAMPNANMPLIQAEKIRLNTNTLSKGVLFTTLISLFTVTVVLSLVAGIISRGV